MSERACYRRIADQLAIEAPAHVFFPVCRWDRPHAPGYCLCSCGKGLPDIAATRAHQAWCRPVSSRESARHPSTSRLLGGSP
jgi:hypothetical protein